MKTNELDYPFPNGVVAFWFFELIPFVFIAITLVWTLVAPKSLNQDNGSLILVIGVAMLFMVSTLVATLIANSFPAIRLVSNGIEIRFYFPLLTRWQYLSWAQIDSIKLNKSNTVISFAQALPPLIIQSKHLPFFYSFPTLLIGSLFGKGFFVSERLIGYSQLLASIPNEKLNPS